MSNVWTTGARLVKAFSHLWTSTKNDMDVRSALLHVTSRHVKSRIALVTRSKANVKFG